MRNRTRPIFANNVAAEGKATEWAFDRIEEAFEKVAKDEARKLSTVQEIMKRNADYLRRIIAPLEDKESHNVQLVPAL